MQACSVRAHAQAGAEAGHGVDHRPGCWAGRLEHEGRGRASSACRTGGQAAASARLQQQRALRRGRGQQAVGRPGAQVAPQGLRGGCLRRTSVRPGDRVCRLGVPGAQQGQQRRGGRWRPPRGAPGEEAGQRVKGLAAARIALRCMPTADLSRCSSCKVHSADMPVRRPGRPRQYRLAGAAHCHGWRCSAGHSTRGSRGESEPQRPGRRLGLRAPGAAGARAAAAAAAAAGPARPRRSRPAPRPAARACRPPRARPGAPPGSAAPAGRPPWPPARRPPRRTPAPPSRSARPQPTPARAQVAVQRGITSRSGPLQQSNDPVL